MKQTLEVPIPPYNIVVRRGPWHGKGCHSRYSVDPTGDDPAPMRVGRTFTGAYDALDFLEIELPLRLGERAVKICRDALNESVPAVMAREAFLMAYLEAGMPAVRALSKALPEVQPMRPAIAVPL